MSTILGLLIIGVIYTVWLCFYIFKDDKASQIELPDFNTKAKKTSFDDSFDKFQYAHVGNTDVPYDD